MATRSQVGFYNTEPKTDEELEKNWRVLVYRHWDGYPDGVLPELLPIVRDFHKNRGLSDAEYAGAWLVAKWKDDYLNIGISKGFHSDIEYFYAVSPTSVKVYEANMWDSFKVKLVDTINIQE